MCYKEEEQHQKLEFKKKTQMKHIWLYIELKVNYLIMMHFRLILYPYNL